MTSEGLKSASIGSVWDGAKNSLTDGANGALVAFAVIAVLSAAYRINRSLQLSESAQRRKS